MSGAGYPSATNTFVPNGKATGGLIVGFSRNAKDFPVNSYIQMFPVDKMVAFYWEYTSQNAGRILTSDDAEHLWADGASAPSGADNQESFQVKPVITQRRVYPFTIGELAADQADWDIMLAYSRDMAQQCMTARTLLTYGALSGATWGANEGNVGTILGNAAYTWLTGSDGLGSNQGPNILKSLNYASLIINQQTLGVVGPADLALVVNPTLAVGMSESTEIRDYIKQSPYAMAQVRGDVPSQNGKYGMPDMLYGHPFIVEDAVRVSSHKGAASTTLGYIIPNDEAYLLARPGKLTGIAGSRSYSTVQMFWHKDEMTVENMYDVNNKRYAGRVITNFQIVVATVKSGFKFQGCYT